MFNIAYMDAMVLPDINSKTFKATPIYTDTLSDLRRGTRRIIHQGGQWSGKTVGILGALATLCSEETDGKVTTVTAQSFPHLKGGALRDFETYVYPFFKGSIARYHKTDHVFTFKSGAMIEFKVFENEMSARGPKRKRLFINEANSFPKMTFFQLDSRSDQTVLDYNPSIRFWAHEDLINQDGNHTYISNHMHNPFMSESRHAEIEGICTFEYDNLGKIVTDDKGKPKILSGDYELWKVYARGLTGNVTGVIFPDWKMIDDCDFPTDEEWFYSIDFGYTIDPTALMKCCKIGKNLYVKELAYETGLSDHSIFNILRAEGFDMDESILYCEHDPDMIRELRNVGIVNALPARKGAGSIKAGIELLKKFNVFYPSSSRNLHRERSMYVWEKRKDTGETINVPVENNNHTFDAIRYGVYSKYLKQTF